MPSFYNQNGADMLDLGHRAARMRRRLFWEAKMRDRGVKLYNVIFPIWLLWLFPGTWFVVLPACFLIDLFVVALTLKYLKVKEAGEKVKAVILKVWLCGFAADLIGTVGMLSTLFMDGGRFGGGVGDWLRRNVAAAVERNPFDSIFGLLWVAGCVALAAFFIYLFNYRFCLSKAGLDEGEKKKLALSLAVFTAPYLFFLPTEWLFY